MSVIDDVLFFAEPLPPDERVRLIAQLWLSLPAGHWAAPTDEERSELERKLAANDLGGIGKIPRLVTEKTRAPVQRWRPRKIYSAPRRFDLFTVLVVTTAYALMFGGARLLGLPPIVTAYVAAFITIVGVGQAILFGGRHPRAASVVSGVVASLALGILSITSLEGRFYIGSLGEAFAFIALWSAFWGSLLGYIAGVFVGSVFLVADLFRRQYGHDEVTQPHVSQD